MRSHYLLNTQATINGTTSQTAQVRVGVELNVVARSHSDGTITLRLHPEVGRLVQFTTLSSGIALPQISRRFVDTQVRLKDGETLVIGGLIENDDIYALRKVPFLGDLPFLRALVSPHTKKPFQQRDRYSAESFDGTGLDFGRIKKIVLGNTLWH